MSYKAKVLLNLFQRRKITVAGIKKAFSDGVITKEEYEIIIKEGAEA